MLHIIIIANVIKPTSSSTATDNRILTSTDNVKSSTTPVLQSGTSVVQPSTTLVPSVHYDEIPPGYGNFPIWLIITICIVMVLSVITILSCGFIIIICTVGMRWKQTQKTSTATSRGLSNPNARDSMIINPSYSNNNIQHLEFSHNTSESSHGYSSLYSHTVNNIHIPFIPSIPSHYHPLTGPKILPVPPSPTVLSHSYDYPHVVIKPIRDYEQPVPSNLGLL